MPPVPVTHESGAVEQLSLTDQDVELLHEIVSRAEGDPDAEALPFRAVFAAYEAVLSERGIEAERDQTYLRFLFLLGNRNARGEGLYARFEALLAELGIELEYSDGGGHGVGTTPGTDHESDAGHAVAGPNGIGRRKARPRRASFNSVYDLSTEVTQRSATRPSSRLSESRVDDIEQSADNPINENTLLHAAREHPDALRELARSLLASVPGNGNRLQPVQNNGTAPNGRNSGEVHLESRDRRSDQAETERGHAEHQEATNDADQEESGGTSSSDVDAIEEPAVPSEFFYQPSLSHLIRDASVFNMYRQRSSAKGLLRFWAERAKLVRDNAEAMDKVAVRHDQTALCRQAFDIWLVRLRQKREEAQTERFFRHLEERAARARDLYLLTKVFTHWGQVTSDEIQKTSAARRHILSVKYFNAWREVTAINELKVQRFTLRKPFRLWLGRLRLLRRDQGTASEFNDRSICRRFYWGLFWHFSYQLMPQWRDYRLKSRSLIGWLRKFRGLRDWEREVDVCRQRNLIQSAFQLWSQKSRTVTLAEAKADKLLTSKLMKDNIGEWRIQRHLRSAAAQVSDSVRLRALRSSFRTWVSRTRSEVKAREFDRDRIARNAWTVWNDQLRHQALSRRIDERVVMQALYKWVLVQRSHLMTRVHQHHLMSGMLTKLMMNSRGLYTHLLQREEEFKLRHKKELARQKLSVWRKQLQIQQQREHMALEFYAPRVEQEALDVWKSRSSHLNKLDSWAKDARFYFLTMTTVKKWHAASIDSAKRRKETAYATIRRKVKVNLATAALTSWRSQAVRVTDLERQADQVRLKNLFRRATGMFDFWVTKTSRHVGHIRDSDTYYSRQLVYNNLSHWIGAFRALRTDEEKATEFLDIHVSRLAAAQLRKLSLRIFQMRTSFETADAQNDRNTRKHFKSILRHWAVRAQESRSSGPATTPIVTTTTPVAPGNSYSLSALDEEDELRDADGMLDVNELLSQPSATPRTPMAATPGYLNSPSKRAARAKSLAQLSTTPATPLRTPFAGRLLSRGTATEPRGSTARKGFAPKGAMGATVRFAVEEEDEEEEEEEYEDEEPESPTKGRQSFRGTS